MAMARRSVALRQLTRPRKNRLSMQATLRFIRMQPMEIRWTITLSPGRELRFLDSSAILVANDILANRLDNATVCSTVGFVGDACWLIGGGNCWQHYPDRRVREAVRIIIAWTTIAHPPTTFPKTAKEPRTAQRTLEQWTTPIMQRYVPRSVSSAIRVGSSEVVNSIGGC